MYNNKNNEIINLQVKSFENSQNLNATIYDLLNFASNLIKSGFKIVETVILKTNLETLESQQKKKKETKDKSLKIFISKSAIIRSSYDLFIFENKYCTGKMIKVITC